MAWEEYLRQEWNKPSRTDYYLMQIAREIRSIQYSIARKKMKQKNLKDYLIPFRFGKKKMRPEKTSQQPSMDKETFSRIAIARWMTWLGGKGGNK